MKLVNNDFVPGKLYRTLTHSELGHEFLFWALEEESITFRPTKAGRHEHVVVCYVREVRAGDSVHTMPSPTMCVILHNERLWITHKSILRPLEYEV